MADNEIFEAITPVGTLNYVYVDEPQEDDNGKKWYKVTIAWEKNRKDELTELRRQATNAAKAKWGNSIPKLQTFLRDGDNTEHNSSDVESLHGCYYFTAKCKDKPGLIDGKKRDLTPLDVYSGCKARISVIMGAYDNKGKKGIWIRLQNVQKAADGERIGGRPSAKEQFDNLDGIEDDNGDGDDLL